MSIALGMVALSMLGAGPEKPIVAEYIGYTVRTVEMPAMGWLEKHSYDLKLVGRQGTSEIWTSSRATADALASRKGAEVKTTLSNPVGPGVQAVAGIQSTRYFLTAFTPVVGQGNVAFVEQTEPVLEGCRTSIVARETAGGLRAQVHCASNWVADVRDVGVPTSSVGHDFARTIQVPQVVSCEIHGEWTIPSDGALIINLGTNRPEKKDAPIVERIAIVEPRKVPMAYSTEARTDSNGRKLPGVASLHPMPALPDRSLLPAIGPDGKPVTLPSLPDTQVSTTMFSDPPAIRPSPQTNTPVASYIINPVIPQPRSEPMPIAKSKLGPDGSKIASTPASAMKFDPSVAQAHYEPMPIGPANLVVDGAKLASGRPQSLHIPLTERLAIDVNIRIVPAKQQAE